MEFQTAMNEVVELEDYYKDVNRTKMSAWLIKKGLPIEIVTRLDDLWDDTKVIAGRVITVGKIIFCRILEFIKSYPHAAIGTLVGAAIGALINGVPLLGPLLAPLTSGLGAVVGAVAGATLDTGKGDLQSIILVAKDFFMMIIDIFNAIFNYKK